MNNRGHIGQHMGGSRRIADAAIPALSEDRRFATADNTALQTGKVAIACAGYRIASVPGLHPRHKLPFGGATNRSERRLSVCACWCPN
jgi:hypothetical protein